MRTLGQVSRPSAGVLPESLPPQDVLTPHLPSKDSKPSSNGHKSLLRKLREDKGISQRKMAMRLGISRNQVNRLEQKSGKKVSLGEIEALAPAFNMRPDELFFRLFTSQRELFYRTHLTNPFFTFEPADGIRISSLIRQNPSCFIGRIQIPPKATLPKDRAPKGDIVFYCMEKGNLLISLLDRECVLKEGECFTLEGQAPYELYNSHSLYEAVAMIVTLPSFL